jgi:mono/diheme cytochrome c family protein
MIAALVFVVGFVVVGLSVVFVAFSSGRGRARGGRRGPSRTARRAIGVGVAIVILGLGVAVPLAIAIVNGDNHAKTAPGGVDLNASQEAGRSVFARYCSTCHTLRASNAVGKVGPNLDALRPPKALVLDAVAKGRAKGRGQMPAGVVTGEDAQDVAAYVAAVAGHQ